MSNIDEKLIQLAETKSNIKDAIISKGVEVDPSTPFGDYADKIKEIQSGGGEDIIAPLKGGHCGNLYISNDKIISSFGRSKFAYNFYNRNDSNIVKCRFRLASTYITTDQVIVMTEGCYNLRLTNGYVNAFCWKDNITYTDTNKLTATLWYYVCIKFDKIDENTVRKRYYISDTDFSLDDSNKIFDFEDNISVNQDIGFIGSYIDASANSGYFRGTLDADKYTIEDENGNVIDKLWVGYPIKAKLTEQSDSAPVGFDYNNDYIDKRGTCGITPLNDDDSEFITPVATKDIDIYMDFKLYPYNESTTYKAKYLFSIVHSTVSTAHISIFTTASSSPIPQYFCAGGTASEIPYMFFNSEINRIKISFYDNSYTIYISHDDGITYTPLLSDITTGQRLSDVLSNPCKVRFLGNNATSTTSAGVFGKLYSNTRIVNRNTGEIIWKLGKD